MIKYTIIIFFSFIAATLILNGCGGSQNAALKLETRPLEETKAMEIISSILNKRGYLSTKRSVELSNNTTFKCDYKISEHNIAIEYLTQKDADTIKEIPPADATSKLHVIPARTVMQDPAVQGEPVYLYIIDAKKYEYQYNPTSDLRADITFLEVENRLKRDLKDFLSWHESSTANEK